jgi:DtxR family Mn-dependent transcriptional regulator
MKRKKDRDEYLEQLWYMKENQKDSMDEFKKIMDENFNEEVFNELQSENLIILHGTDKKVYLTEKGEINARQIIRAHRIAERLVSDVLGGEFETVACEFEHIVNPEIVDSICTLLGHPNECPHGRPIPEGECCRRLDKTALTSVISLTELEIGHSARVAYVQCKNDQQLHRIDGLQIRPGMNIKLHQKYPTFVIECEGASIALGTEIASNIRVWSKESAFPDEESEPGRGKGAGWGGFRFRRRKRGA